MKTVYLAASGDLRLSANQTCQPAQAALEQSFTAACEREGAKVKRAHPYDPAKKHGFIDSQKMGLEVFRAVPRDAPVVVAEAVWQYSHHVLPGLLDHSGAHPDREQLERPVARAGGHAQPERLPHQGRPQVQQPVERGLHRPGVREGPPQLARQRDRAPRRLARAPVLRPRCAGRRRQARRPLRQGLRGQEVHHGRSSTKDAWACTTPSSRTSCSSRWACTRSGSARRPSTPRAAPSPRRRRARSTTGCWPAA